MPKCAECGVETDLHELDTPTCPDCITARALIGPPVQDLANEFLAAREHYRNRMAGLGAYPGRPGSAEDVEVQTAKEKYLKALRDYGDALRRNLSRGE